MDLPESSEVPAMPTQFGGNGREGPGTVKTEPGTLQAAHGQEGVREGGREGGDPTSSKGTHW